MFVAVVEVCTMFLVALMIPCARFVGSVTTHCAREVCVMNKAPAHNIKILSLILLNFND